MAAANLSDFLRRLMRRMAAESLSDQSDRQLVERALASRNEAAFEAIVHRHGVMVYRVCWRVLQHPQDAEDAFQATFLVLAQKLRTVRKRASLASWLHGVAQRVAVKAKSRSAMRRQRESVASQPESTPPDDITWKELRLVLDAELAHLPDKWRLPLILCYLEGRTQDDAAAQLGWSKSTLRRSLDQAREALRHRLNGRGVVWPAAFATVLLSDCSTPAAPAAALVAITVEAAASVVSGKTVAAAASAKVAALAEGVLNAMLQTKLKIVAAVLLIMSVVATGTGMLVQDGILTHSEAKAPDQPSKKEGVKDATDRKAEVLAEQKRRLDRFGDPLPAGAVARLGTTRWWHGYGEQECPFCYAPDGKILACCDGGAVRMLDSATGKELHRIESPNDRIIRFAFSPSGKTMVTASRVLRLWDVASCKELRQIADAKMWISAVAFTPDGKTLAAATDDTDIQIWDVATWQKTRQLKEQECPSSLVFLPDGKTLISGGGQARTIQWWDISTGKEIRRMKKALNHSRLLTLSPDGKRLAAVVQPGVLHLWDAASGKEVSKTVVAEESESSVWCLCFSPDSQSLACGNAKTRFFAADDGRELARWSEDKGSAWMAYSPDGKLLAQLGRFFIRLRDVKTGKKVQQPGLPNEVMSVGFTPGGHKLLASGFGGQTWLADPLTGKELTPFRSPPARFAGASRMLLAPALTGDGKKAALVDAKGVLHVWEPDTGTELCRIDDPPVGDDQADFTLDGKLLVVKHQDHIIRVWDTTTGKLSCTLQRFGENRFPHPHAFSPDGRMVATAPSSQDSAVIRLWQTTTGKEVGKLTWSDRSEPTCLRFSADGKFLVSAHGGRMPGSGPVSCSLRLWDLTTGREQRQFPVQYMDIRSAAFSPDGKTLAAADGSTIILFESASGKERGRFAGHRGWIWSVAFSPNGRLLASGSLDYTSLVWDVTGRCPDGKWARHDLQLPEMQRPWAALAGADGVKSFRTLWKMVAAERQTVAFLAEKLRPVPRGDDKRMAQLVVDLGRERFDVRDRASKDLKQGGESAVPALQQALKNNLPLETRRRLEALLADLERQPVSSDDLHSLRALEVLEHIGSRESQQVLEVISKGAPYARITREATASLERLAKQAVDLRR